MPSDFGFEVFPIANGWRMGDAVRIAKLVRHWHPDVVHVQYPTQGYGSRYLPWLLPTLFRVMRMPIVQTWHEYHMETVKRNFLNAVLSGGLIAVRPNYKANMPNWFRWLIRKKRFGFIPNSSAIPTMRLSEREASIIRSQFANPSTRLVVFFGFVYPPKRVELLFEIADPRHHHIVLISNLNSQEDYHKVILDHLNHEPWIGRVTVTGFLPADEVGRILAAADAVVLPFKDGGGIWNTSIHAALAQGTFVLTTAREHHGYEVSRNVYYAQPDNVAEMRDALRTHIGRKRPQNCDDQVSEWETIAEAHVSLYDSVIEFASR